MTADRIATLLELIAELVHDKGIWKDKRDELLAECTSADRTNLAELCSWLEGQLE